MVLLVHLGMKFCLDCQKPKSRKGLYCKPCGYKHRVRPSGLKYEIKVQNKAWFSKGHVPATKGKPSPFKKDNPGYDALHEWVERWAGKPRKCDNCGTTEAKRFDWANKSGKYLRDLTDWIRL